MAGLAFILLANLLLLSLQARNQEGRLLFRSWSLALLTPVAASATFLVNGTRSLLSQYVLLYGARQENVRLRHENALLKLELGRVKGVAPLLERRLDYQRLGRQFQFRTVAASIIWRAAPYYAHRIALDAGSARGIARDSAVLTPEGIVGRVVTCGRASSEVEVITNSGAAAGGMLAESRLQGVLRGDGSALLSWDFIPNSETVPLGVIVYTSGTDRIYPKGLPVGRVVESRTGPMVYREIRVQPLVDYLKLEEVLVVPGSQQTRQGETFEGVH